MARQLDGSMAGDVGFDPLGLSNIDDVGVDLYWLREAELKHGRVAMLACAGVFWVEILGSFPGMVLTRCVGGARPLRLALACTHALSRHGRISLFSSGFALLRFA
jgi:hypothetical protein